MPTRILIVGGGGREHALAWKLAGEPGVNEVVVGPGSEAIAEEPRVRSIPLDPLDGNAVIRAARAAAVELVVIGPEAPLAAGVSDALLEAGIPVFAPSKAAARIETSKAFCEGVADAAGVPRPYARAFTGGQTADATAFIRELAADGMGVVLKADGLAAGKGVIVTDSEDQALEILPSFINGRSADEPALVIQARIDGREASVIALCDGERAIALPAARDHKRLSDDDGGPNTGGMGAYSPLPDVVGDLEASILNLVHRPILAELARRGTPFRGFLYAGLMIDDVSPVLLECNARLGDPEAQVILPRIAGAIGPLLLAGANGRLPTGGQDRVPALPDATVGIVLAAAGYPADPRGGDPIGGLDMAIGPKVQVFHSGTSRGTDGQFFTKGGRVLTVVGRGTDLRAARDAAERAADVVSFDGLQRRHDIARHVPPPARFVTVIGTSAGAGS